MYIGGGICKFPLPPPEYAKDGGWGVGGACPYTILSSNTTYNLFGLIDEFYQKITHLSTLKILFTHVHCVQHNYDNLFTLFL